MPQQTMPTGQDWTTQNAGRGDGLKSSSIPKSGRELDSLKAKGLITTEKRQSNSSGTTIMSARKLDEATEAVHIARVDKELSKAIAQARTALKLSQKDLATAINSKPQIIAEYENGKAIPDGKIIAALERKLQTKLPRPGKTKLPPKDPVAAAKAAQVKAATNGGLTRGGPPKRR